MTPYGAPAEATGLLEKLMAVVRPEFRSDILIPACGDRVLAGNPCAVPGCGRRRREHGFCLVHLRRWQKRGQPEVTGFLADPGPPPRGRATPQSCLVAECRYSGHYRGLCDRHCYRWDRAGRPEVTTWAEGAAAVPPGLAECRLSFCALWTENARTLFCRTHTDRWRKSGISDAEQFIAECELRGREYIDFRGLAPQLKLELQYAIQRRSDAQAHAALPPVAQMVIQWVRREGVASLLDRSEQQWRQIVGRHGSKGERGQARALLAYAREAIDMLDEGSGWETEYPRDVWRMSRLPGLVTSPDRSAPGGRIRFDRITQPWLRELAKRWTRWRLASGTAVYTATSDVWALARFSQFLALTSVDGLSDVDRALLEHYLAWSGQQPGGHRTHTRLISGIAAFLQAIRRHGWDDSLPPNAMFFPGDYPKRGQQLPRALAEHVMAQVEHPDNLDCWPHPEGRLLTLILIRCGLRISSACTLPFDCLIHDDQGAPYLKYRNTKMKREAAVPIDEEVQSAIHAQQRRVLERFSAGSPHLFPRHNGNAGGQHSWPTTTYRNTLYRWLQACDIRDEHGRPVHLTPHQWRHTLGTRLINRDVPQEVVRVLLDHESSEMTGYYAKITDKTVRRHWEQAAKVNIKGERVRLEPDGPLAQAQWAKTRYGIATQTLPNGYCGLPVQKSCPHANACLTCPVFLTGPEFLPELREQRQRTLTLIDVSTSQGQARVVEMNQQVLTNLDRMIGEAEKDVREDAADAG